MKNLTQEWKAVSEERKGVGAKPGHDLVILEIIDHGLRFEKVVLEGEKFKAKRRNLIGRLPEYASYAVNNNRRLRFMFTDRFDHMSASHYFDLSFTVLYHVSEAERIVAKLSDDPLKMLQDEIKRVVGGAVARLPWQDIVDSKLENNFSELAKRVIQGAILEELTLFASEVGIGLEGIDTVLNLTSEDREPIAAKTVLDRQERLAEIAKQKEEAELKRREELNVPRQIVARQEVSHQIEIDLLKKRGKMGEGVMDAVGKVLDNVAGETRTPEGFVRAVEMMGTVLMDPAAVIGSGANGAVGALGGGMNRPLIGTGQQNGHELQTVLNEALRRFSSSNTDVPRKKMLSCILHWVAENYRGKDADAALLDRYRDMILDTLPTIPGGVDSESFTWLQQLLKAEDLQVRLAS